jgi:hypothetical protein
MRATKASYQDRCGAEGTRSMPGFDARSSTVDGDPVALTGVVTRIDVQ